MKCTVRAIALFLVLALAVPSVIAKCFYVMDKWLSGKLSQMWRGHLLLRGRGVEGGGGQIGLPLS